MAYGHAERNLALLRRLEAETQQLLENLNQPDPEQSAWLQEVTSRGDDRWGSGHRGLGGRDVTYRGYRLSVVESCLEDDKVVAVYQVDQPVHDRICLSGVGGGLVWLDRAGGLGEAGFRGSCPRVRRPVVISDAASMGARAVGERPFPDRPAGTDTLPQIDHILVLMMENHTYDNWLGMLGRGPGQHPRGDGFTIGPGGQPTAANPAPGGQTQHAFHMPTTCQLAGKPTQEWTQCHIQFNGGRNDGFVKSGSGPVAMGYWTGADLPWSYSLATTFPVGDRWFAPVLGQTYPNRRYLLAATSVGMVDDILPEVIGPSDNGTIFDLLNAHQIPWRNYYSTFPATSYLYLGDAIRNHPSIVGVDQFFADAKSDSLPGFAIIDPNWGTNSGEDPQNIVHAEVFAASVVQAVMDSPAWPRTLLVWTFDEGGGYYDHVPPPAAAAPDDIGPDWPAPAYTGFAQYGFRVPAVVVSPWSRADHVTSVVHDHTSILAMAERKWNLPALTHRDAAANDLSDFLDLTHATFATPPTLATPAAGPAQLACEKTGPGQIPPPGSVTPG